MSQFSRTLSLIGQENVNKLANCHVAVFGLGGVGSYVVEALARAGVGQLTVVDDDVVQPSNINRQLFALHSTVGMAKTAVAKARIADINPNAVVNEKTLRFDQTTAPVFDFSTFDYVVDAIDTVTSKLLLTELCHKFGTPIISSMGTGNKMHNTCFQIADISQTSVCPLAKVMRRELKKRGIPHLKVVFSAETPKDPQADDKRTPASISFVPPVAGLVLAGEVVRNLVKWEG